MTMKTNTTMIMQRKTQTNAYSGAWKKEGCFLMLSAAIFGKDTANAFFSKLERLLGHLEIRTLAPAGNFILVICFTVLILE